MSSQTNQPRVRKRRVFYIPGYDPIHPRRYRELYRKESRAQAEISGYEVSVSAKSGQGPYGWNVRSHQDGAEVEADIDVLVWSDIVRDSMSTSIPATYVQLIRTAWIYIATGTLWRLMRLRKGPVIAALYPVGMLVVQLALAVVLAGIVIAALKPVLTWGAVIPAIVAAGALMRWFRKIDNRLFAYYLMHDYAYSAQLRGAVPAGLRSRLSTFVALIQDALETDVDEVLVVGHSSGAHLGVMVLADLIRAGGVADQRPKLSFLTLGQVVPMVSFLPNAHDLRADLQFLAQQGDLSWVDVSAPGDGCAFALCDPVGVSGVATEGCKMASGPVCRLYPNLVARALAGLALAVFSAAFSISLQRLIDLANTTIFASRRGQGFCNSGSKGARPRNPVLNGRFQNTARSCPHDTAETDATPG